MNSMSYDYYSSSSSDYNDYSDFYVEASNKVVYDIYKVFEMYEIIEKLNTLFKNDELDENILLSFFVYGNTCFMRENRHEDVDIDNIIGILRPVNYDGYVWENIILEASSHGKDGYYTKYYLFTGRIKFTIDSGGRIEDFEIDPDYSSSYESN